jgi:HSP20 family protein
MATNTLAKKRDFLPSSFDDFFKPWNEWFETGFKRMLTIPAVNVADKKDYYEVSMAVPGFKKDDLNIDVDESLMTISAADETEKEDKDEGYTRKEYNYSSFSRSFSLPQDVNKEKITATYTDGILCLRLPKKDISKSTTSKITVD